MPEPSPSNVAELHRRLEQKADSPKGPFIMSCMSHFNFWACAMVRRAGARKYLFLAHIWALLGLGRIAMAGRGGGRHCCMRARVGSDFGVGLV